MKSLKMKLVQCNYQLLIFQCTSATTIWKIDIAPAIWYNKTKPKVLRAEYIGDIMDKLTGLGKTIIGTDPDKMRLDQAVKNILV